MHIKAQLRRLLGDVVVKLSDKDWPLARVANRSIVKHLIPAAKLLSPNSLNSPQETGGIVRILASDRSNADHIADLVQNNSHDLDVRSVAIHPEALQLANSHRQQPLYSHSVLVEVCEKTTFKSATLVVNNRKFLQRQVLELPENEPVQAQRVVVEFSSPNIAKQFHYGHLKSTILGNFLANLNTFVGHQVTRLNFVGDWGTQFGLLILGLQEFGDESDINDIKDGNRSALSHMLDVYVKATERASTDDAFYQRAKEKNLSLDKQSDDELLARWHQIRDLSIIELKRAYDRLGVKFDAFEFESEFTEKSKELVRLMQSIGFVTPDDTGGALVAHLEKNGRPLDVPVLRSDGASLYLTRDVAAALSRQERYKFDRMLYVVGIDQERHFHCLSQIVSRLGHPECANRLEHIKTGKVLGMSTRSGQFKLLSEIMDQATSKYIESTKSTHTTRVSTGDQIESVARQLALSALFVYDLQRPRMSHYEFAWDKQMLSGPRSGINLQTTYARLCSLHDRAAESGLEPFEAGVALDKINLDAIKSLPAINLLSCMSELDDEIYASYWSNESHPLVQHSLKLCATINLARRSRDLWVLGEPSKQLARSRLTLFEAARSQLELLIRLIGLEPLEKV